MPLILDRICKSFDDGGLARPILNGSSLRVPDGVLMGLRGASGSGKSTVLAIAGALLTPDSGAVTVGSLELTGLGPAALTAVRRERLGFVFQADQLIPSLTSEEQLTLAARISGARMRGPGGARARARALLEEVGLGDAVRRRPAELSGGMRQRVNVARALMNDPEVLLVDEPTSALDEESGRQVCALIARLVRDRGVAALLVSHEEETLSVCDEVATLREGRVTVPGRVG